MALFENNPVLFVGYSHSDTIMEYLARAIPVSTPRRFILTDDPDVSKWSRLGIEPIAFDEEDFEAQNEGVGKLAAAVNRGAADWRDMIRNAVISQPAALSDEDADVLHFGLSDASDALTNVRVFTNYAKTFEWVTWLDQHNLLAHLFDQEKFGDEDSLYASWIASEFALQNADEVFTLIGQKNLRLHPQFWYRLTFQVGSGDETLLTSEDLGRWVSIFLSKALGATHDDFASILERCVKLDRLEDALDILDVVTEPKIQQVSSRNDMSFGEADVRIGSDQWHLGRMMSALQLRVPEVSERLVGIATSHLAKQHRQLVAWELADQDFSQPSIHRETIEGEVDAGTANSEDILIDMARVSLVSLTQNDPTQAATWIGRLSSSDVPLLRRLASFAIAELPE